MPTTRPKTQGCEPGCEFIHGLSVWLIGALLQLQQKNQLESSIIFSSMTVLSKSLIYVLNQHFKKAYVEKNWSWKDMIDPKRYKFNILRKLIK